MWFLLLSSVGCLWSLYSLQLLLLPLFEQTPINEWCQGAISIRVTATSNPYMWPPVHRLLFYRWAQMQWIIIIRERTCFVFHNENNCRLIQQAPPRMRNPSNVERIISTFDRPSFLLLFFYLHIKNARLNMQGGNSVLRVYLCHERGEKSHIPTAPMKFSLLARPFLFFLLEIYVMPNNWPAGWIKINFVFILESSSHTIASLISFSPFTCWAQQLIQILLSRFYCFETIYRYLWFSKYIIRKHVIEIKIFKEIKIYKGYNWKLIKKSQKVKEILGLNIYYQLYEKR